MNPTLHQDITRRLLADYELREKGGWLREGRCPNCHKRELYTKAESPWVVRCGRTNKCGWEGHVKDLYSDLFESWSDRFRVSEAHPTAAADAYLQHARGFDLARIRGWYTQENYFDREADAATATVRFALPGGGWWERLIDKPQRFGKKKARFAYGKSYAGHWWCPPSLDLGAAARGTLKELWIVEGIFDAIALLHHGIAAVAAMSSNNFPEHALAELARAFGADRPTLVWALDGDESGRGFTRKWVRRAREAGWDCAAAQIPQTGKSKIDWNDLHQRDRLGEAEVNNYRYHGALLIARNASAKALLIYQQKGWASFPFDYASRLYWFELDLNRYHKAMEALEKKDDGSTEEERREQALQEANAITEIANCMPTALYYQANTITDEAWYYFRVEFPHDGQPIKNTFSGGQVSAAAEFKKRLLHIAPGAVFTGSSAQLDRLMKAQLYAIKRVETVDFVGYSREHGCWVFGDLAVKDGKIYELNSEDFFDIDKLSIKTLNQSVALAINRDRNDYRTDWLDMLWRCFGAKGLVALAFWLGSLFAEQLRGMHKSYPFLEVVGEAGSGKSTLLEFLWMLLGRRDYEGFDPNKYTQAARARTLAQTSNLPVVLIESDRDKPDVAHARQFDWDELKTAYNGRAVRGRGVRNSGNETYEPPFRGAIVISQNAGVNASDAVLQRIVHMSFDKAGHTLETKRLAEELARMPVEQVSGFLLAAIVREAKVLATVSQYMAGYETRLQGKVRALRIAKNHAQIMALVDALDHVVRLTREQKDAALDLLTTMAVERQQAINADHPIVQEFWEQFEYLDGEDVTPRLNHSRDDELIAVNLVHFAEEAARRGLRPPAMSDLKRLLPTSKARRFVERKAVCSSIFIHDGKPRTVKCWVFARGA